MTVYYIDPNSGGDSNCGSDQDAPWKTFAPLAEKHLKAADRVEVLDAGAFDTSLYIKGAEGSSDNPVEIKFASGRYDFYPEGLQKRCYNISNNNDEPDDPKNVGVLVEDSKHVIISGPGAQIVCHGKMISFCFDSSECVTLRDMAVDYYRPTVSEFEVKEVSEESVDISVHPDSHYTVKEEKITWVGDGWSYDTGLAQELIVETDQIWRRKDPLLDMRIEEIAPGLIRATGRHSMQKGRVFQLRDTYRDCVGMFVRRSKGIRFDSIRIFYLHGMGIVGQFSEDICLERVYMQPDKGSGRTCCVSADCTHFSGCRGKITYRDCIFDGAHDDAINIHGTYMQIQEIKSDNSLRLRFMHRQTYGFAAVNADDDIDFVRWDSLEILGTARVNKVDVIDPHELQVEFESAIPDGVREKDVIENVSWTPKVEVVGCTVRRIPTRGYLITTRKKVLVDGNRFIRIHRNGLNIESDASNWFESGCVRDMTISNNVFDQCGGEAILISPRYTAPNSSVHQNIRITGNTFIVPEDGTAVNACGIRGLVIKGNCIEMPPPIHMRNTIAVNDCDDVAIKGNTLKILGT